MDVLVFLAENAGRVVRKEEILEAVWQGAVVQEVALARTLSELRKSLGDEVSRPRYVETIRKRGYKLIAPVAWGDDRKPDEPSVGRRRRWFALAASIAATLVVAWFWWRPSGKAGPGVAVSESGALGAAGSGPAVAILEFRQLSAGSRHQWLSEALHELIATELAFSRDLRVVPGKLVSELSRELGVSGDEWLLPQNVRQIQNQLGVDFLVTGAYFAQREKAGVVRLDLTLWDVEESAAVVTVVEKGSEGDILKLVSRAGAQMREVLGRGKIEEPRQVAFRAYLPKEPSNLRLYYSGLGKLRELETAEASKLLMRSLANEPDQPLARLALSEAWSALGYESKAVAEAELALELAQGLPREQWLWVEARLFVAAKRWEEAVDRLRALSLFSPGNLEYGLRLARAQLEKGEPREALNTIESIREKAEEQKSDPRLELVAAEAAAALGLYETARELAGTAIELAAERGSELIVAHARHLEGKTMQAQGKVPQAFTTLEEAALAFVSVGDRKNEAFTQITRAGWLQEGGDFPRAQDELERALSTFRELGDRGGEAAALTRLGSVLARQGLFDDAKQMFKSAIDTYREVGNRVGEAESLHGLGDVMGREGLPDQAQEPFENALAIAREVGNKDLAALMLFNLGKVHHLRGEVSLGLADKLEAVEIFDQTGLEYRSAQIRCFIGQAQRMAGELGLAAEVYEQAVAKAAAINSDRIQACGLNGLGQVFFSRGDFLAARVEFEAALALRVAMKNTPGVVETRWHRAETFLAEGRYDEAENEAIALVDEARASKHLEAQALDLLARLYVQRGEKRKADAALEDLLARRAETPEVLLEIEIVKLWDQSRKGGLPSARERLDEIAATASANGHWTLENRARFVLGEAEFLYGEAARGRRILMELQSDAQSRGWRLLAERALLLLEEKQSRGWIAL